MSTSRRQSWSVRAVAWSLALCAAAPAARAAEHTVSINNVKYEPATIEVKAGDTVVWKNQDERDHTVVSDKKAAESFNSGRIAANGSYKRTFKKVGKYAYHCDYHPRMKGTVVVKE